ATFHAGAAFAAMTLAAFVARPSARVVHAEVRALACDIGLGQGDEWTEQLDLRVSAEAHGFTHRLHKIFAAVRIDRMVAAVCGDDEALGADAFGETARDAQHDRVAKRHHGLL